MKNLFQSLYNQIPFKSLKPNVVKKVNLKLAEAQSAWESFSSIEVFGKEQNALNARKYCTIHNTQELEKDIKECLSFNAEADFSFIKSQIDQNPHSIDTQERIENLRIFTLDKWQNLITSKKIQWQKKLFNIYKKNVLDEILAIIKEQNILQDFIKMLGDSGLGGSGGFGANDEAKIQNLLEDSQDEDSYFQSLKERAEEIQKNRFDNNQDLKQSIETMEEEQAEGETIDEVKLGLRDLAKEILENNIAKNDTHKDAQTLQQEILDLLKVREQERGQERIGRGRGFSTEKAITFLKENRKLSAFCDSLGSQDKKEQKPISIKAQKNESRGKEHLVGVTLGRDLENVLPQELALLDDKDLEIIFDLKFIESRLMCVEKEALFSIDETSIEEEIAANKGAIILCIDTSGSMCGEPEFVAKAVALYLCLRALKQKRALYLINFSSHIECIRLYGGGSVARCLRFLRSSFNGGTDVEIALKEGVRVMGQDDFSLSDLVVISDGYFNEPSNELIQDMDKVREGGNRFLLLEIGWNDQANKDFCAHYRFHSQKLTKIGERTLESKDSKDAKDSKDFGVESKKS